MSNIKKSDKWVTFDQEAERGTMRMLAASQPLGWQGMFANYMEVRPFGAMERAIEGNAFIMQTAGRVAHLRRRFDGRWAAGYSLPHSLCATPTGFPAEMGFELIGDEYPTNILFGVNDLLMAQVTGDLSKGDPQRHQIQERFLFRDPFVEQIGWTLIRLLQDADDGARLYAESLGVSLAHHMLRVYSLNKPAITAVLPSLSQSQVKRALEYLDSHYAQPIGLEELANSVGMSQTHFSDVFRKATGYAPHQYLIRLRCEKACALLSGGKLSVRQVAAMVGFFDHSHLIRHFKRIYGVTPQQWASRSL